LNVAKSRLAGDPRARRDIALGMFRGTILTCQLASLVGTVLVVTGDRTLAETARCMGARSVPERRNSDLNLAAEQGRDAALRLRPGKPVALVVSDLPRLRADDLDSVLAR
jgi:2-phospho-L-lactate guanylyltransferase